MGACLPHLLVLTDRHQLPAGRDLVTTLRACVAGGARGIVVREVDLDDTERARLVRAVADAAGDVVADVRDVLVVSARNLLPGATGVHLAAHQTGLDARGVGMHGRSCHDEGEVRRAVGAGASYLTLSPVAPSASKPGYGPPLGSHDLRRAADLAQGVPVFALGGVDVHNAAHLREAGAHGVAVMGALMRTPDPEAATRRLLEEVVR
jgi:thiamine-phosphate pyrophosphorylase